MLNSEATQTMLVALTPLMPTLKRLAGRHCKAPADIEDLVQDTLFTALRFAHSYNPQFPLEPWLCVIMRNLFYTQLRKRRTDPLVHSSGLIPNTAIAPSQEWSVYCNDVDRSLRRMKPKVREALIAISDETSFSEGAMAVGCALGTFKGRIRAGRRALTQDLGQFL